MTPLECLDGLLDLLNDIYTRKCDMSWDDIADVCKCREMVAATLNARYNEDTSRFERTE